jgi:hypothetical protein
MTQEVGSQNCIEQMQMWTENEPWCTKIEEKQMKVTGICLDEKP